MTRPIAILALVVTLVPCAGADDARSRLPIFDAHVHYSAQAWDLYPPARVLGMMDAAGVAMALVSSTPDEGTLRLLEHAPARIVPEVRPYHGGLGPSSWLREPAVVDYLRERLATYPHRGIGEFHVIAPDEVERATLARVASLAVEQSVAVHVHSGARAVRWLFETAPRLTVLWAHAGMSEPPEVVRAMLDRYPSLYAETSYREREIVGGREGLDPAWRDLLVDHADRFLVATDTWANARWADYAALVEGHRRWLRALPPTAARKIAHENAERLFGVDISRAPIGTR